MLKLKMFRPSPQRILGFWWKYFGPYLKCEISKLEEQMEVAILEKAMSENGMAR
jgi:hypothetical protein